MSDVSGRPKILIVEDEFIVAADLQATLEALGYDVPAAVEFGRAAIDAAATYRPDLVLMDIRLTGSMDGIAAAAEIRRRWSIPAVFLTANANDETVLRASEAHPYGYLVKPFRAKDLHATIQVALNQHRVASELFAEQTWFQVLLRGLSDGVVATDAAGRIRYMNAAGEHLTGWTLAQALGRPIDEVCPLRSLGGDLVESRPLRRALASAEPVGKERFLLRAGREANRLIPVEASAAPIVSAGKLLGAAAVFVDISEQLRRETAQEEEHHRLEEEVQGTAAALGSTRAELRALSAHLLTAQEEERRRIARELHDDLAQRTVTIEMNLYRLTHFVHEAEGAAALSSARASLRELLDGLRQVSHRLHPALILHFGLPAALDRLVEEYNDAGGAATFADRSGTLQLDLDTGTALFRIAQEALRNARKHVPAAPVRVTLSCRKNELDLSIEDGGPGFDPHAARVRHGLGLLSMHERARLLGGTLVVRSSPRSGTLVQVRLRVLRRIEAEKPRLPSPEPS